MKTKTLIKNKVFTYLLLAVVFSSCVDKSGGINITDNYSELEPIINQNYEEIGHPVKLQYIERIGMKYMIASGLYGQAGVSICNLTLDSLQVEFYKQSLIKDK